MPTHTRHLPADPSSFDRPEVYSAQEVADTAGVPTAVLEGLIAGAEIPDGGRGAHGSARSRRGRSRDPKRSTH